MHATVQSFQRLAAVPLAECDPFPRSSGVADAVRAGQALAAEDRTYYLRRFSRYLRIKQARRTRGEHEIAHSIIGAAIGARGTPAAWQRAEWVTLGREFGERGLRWSWSCVMVEVMALTGWIAEVNKAYSAAELRGRAPCWR